MRGFFLFVERRASPPGLFKRWCERRAARHPSRQTLLRLESVPSNSPLALPLGKRVTSPITPQIIAPHSDSLRLCQLIASLRMSEAPLETCVRAPKNMVCRGAIFAISGVSGGNAANNGGNNALREVQVPKLLFRNSHWVDNLCQCESMLS
jgi:hypothetical protein